MNTMTPIIPVTPCLDAAINCEAVLPVQPLALTPLQSKLRHKLRCALRDGPSENTSALILILNWVRGLPGIRGFSPLKRVGTNGNDHGHRSLLALIESRALGLQLAGLLEGESQEDTDKALKDFRLWSLSVARSLWVARFHALPAGTPGLWRLLQKTSWATPHGDSDALAHGKEAQAYWQVIKAHLQQIAHGTELRTSRRYVSERHLQSVVLPAWAKESVNAAWLLNAINKHPDAWVQTYLKMHDCGKAFCMAYDANGKPHYPGHAALSAEVWAKAGGKKMECELMAKDMLVHTISAADCEAFAAEPLAPLLLIAALAEIHANAVPIFGGFDSDSFKIKLKQIERRGNALLKAWVA